MIMTRIWQFLPARVVFAGGCDRCLWDLLGRMAPIQFQCCHSREKQRKLLASSMKRPPQLLEVTVLRGLPSQLSQHSGSPVNAFAMPEDLLLVPNFHHVGKYPLYGRSARFVDVRRGRPFDLNSAIKSYPVGDLTPGLARTSGIRLPQHAPSAAALLRGGRTAVIAQDQHRVRHRGYATARGVAYSASAVKAMLGRSA